MAQYYDPNTGQPPQRPARDYSKIACWDCGEYGHTTRVCRYGQQMRRQQQMQQAVQQQVSQMPPAPVAANAVSGDARMYVGAVYCLSCTALSGTHVMCDSTAEYEDDEKVPIYLKMGFEGKTISCLLDSGCDRSLFPAKMILRSDLTEFNRNTIAANGSEIKILGETVITLEVGGLKIPTKVLVSPNIMEPMLSNKWLKHNRCHWFFDLGVLHLGGQSFQLDLRDVTELSFRRVVVENTTVLLPLCPTQVTSRMELSSLSHGNGNAWSTEVNACVPGACVGRSVFAGKCHDLPVLVLNTTNHPITLKEGTVLSELIPVLCSDSPEPNDADKLGAAIETIVDKVDGSISLDERNKLRQLLSKYSTIISTGELDIGHTDLVQHKIETGDAPPVKQSLRRQPYAYLPAIDEYVDKMVTAGWVVPVMSPYATNIVVVKKQDGSLRFCADYRRLNDSTKKDSYPLPNITTCLEALGGAKYFSSLDLVSAYHQVSIRPCDVEKTTFITRTGTYAYKRMAFGLTNACATFQRLIDLVLKGLHPDLCLIYLDDVIVMSATIEGLLERMELVFQRLEAAKLKIKPTKCNFLQVEVHFLGHIINARGIATDPKKIADVVDWPVPRDSGDVRSFMGLCSYYRKFVEGFAQIAAPLCQLMGVNVKKFEWSEACQEAFDQLKLKLTTSPVLALPRPGCPYILDTDASMIGIGAVLSQVQDNREVVIAYASRSLSAAQKSYCVTRLELLAVISYLKYFRCYLLGAPFLLRTDHSALSYLQRTPELQGQQARWLEVTQEFDFETRHRAGTQHGNADALSRRRPCKQCGLGELVSEVFVSATRTGNLGERSELAEPEMINRDQIKLATETDADLHEFCQRFNDCQGARPSWEAMISKSPLQKTLWVQWDRLKFEDGILYRRYFSTDGFHEHWQTIVPKLMQKTVLTLTHKGFRGHFGVHRTVNQVQSRAYWPGWARDVESYVHSCLECARFIQGKPRRQGLLQPMTVGAPFERVSIDLTGPHVRSTRGNVYILTLICAFTKWAEAFAIRNKEAVTVARVLVDQYFTKMAGLSMSLLSDRGTEFSNNLLSEVCRLLQIDKFQTTAYKPSTNGQIERWHRTLNLMLGKVVAENQKDWDDHLPFVLCAYRAARHESTGFSPNFLVLGRELMAPIDIVCGPPESERIHYENASDFVEKRQRMMEGAFRLVRQALKTSTERNKKYYDMKVRPNAFDIGQFVYFYYPRKFAKRSTKWQRLYIGPLLVIKVLGPVTYLIQKTPRSTPIVAHVDKLKAYTGDDLKPWITVPAHCAGDMPITEIVPPVVANACYVLDDVSVFTNRMNNRQRPADWTGRRPEQRVSFSDQHRGAAASLARPAEHDESHAHYPTRFGRIPSWRQGFQHHSPGRRPEPDSSEQQQFALSYNKKRDSSPRHRAEPTAYHRFDRHNIVAPLLPPGAYPSASSLGEHGSPHYGSYEMGRRGEIDRQTGLVAFPVASRRGMAEAPGVAVAAASSRKGRSPHRYACVVAHKGARQDDSSSSSSSATTRCSSSASSRGGYTTSCPSSKRAKKSKKSSRKHKPATRAPSTVSDRSSSNEPPARRQSRKTVKKTSQKMVKNESTERDSLQRSAVHSVLSPAKKTAREELTVRRVPGRFATRVTSSATDKTVKDMLVGYRIPRRSATSVVTDAADGEAPRSRDRSHSSGSARSESVVDLSAEPSCSVEIGVVAEPAIVPNQVSVEEVRRIADEVIRNHPLWALVAERAPAPTLLHNDDMTPPDRLVMGLSIRVPVGCLSSEIIEALFAAMEARVQEKLVPVNVAVQQSVSAKYQPDVVRSHWAVLRRMVSILEKAKRRGCVKSRSSGSAIAPLCLPAKRNPPSPLE